MTFVPFNAADDIANRFLDLLQRHGIQPPVGSTLEDELLSVTQLLEVIKNPNLAKGADQVSILRSAAGLHDLAAKVLSVEPIDEFETFIPHLRLIAETKVRAASLGQNASSGPYDHTARKMVELYMGCLAAHVGSNVVLDPPTTSKGDNPDVIFMAEPVEEGVAKKPQRWALAIKTTASRQGQTIFDRIKEGADQIDDPKCLADKGMVVINAKSALRHDALWETPFPDIEAAKAALGTQIDELVNSAEADRPQAEWDRLFKHKVVRPVLFLGQSLVRLDTHAGAQTPTALKMIKAYGAGGVLDTVGASLADRMNDFMHRILLGVPGGPGRWPQ